jgi:hypothetical protein
MKPVKLLFSNLDAMASQNGISCCDVEEEIRQRVLQQKLL